MPCHLPCALKRSVLLLFLSFFGFAAGCTKFDLLNATIPSCGYQSINNLSYGGIPRQKLDIYRPRHLPVNAKPGAPVVVFFYGGYWTAGEKRDYRFVGEAITREGFVAVLPDYRLYPQTTFPGFIEDGALAVRWVVDHIDQFGGDPRRIYLMGHSAGAHLVALLTLDEHYLKAVGLEQKIIRATVALAGPYDFVPDESDGPAFNSKPGEISDQRIEPLHFANGHSPPMLLVQGLKDEVVEPRNAVELSGAIRRAGGEAMMLTYPKRGHADLVLAMAWSFRWLAPVMHDAAVFIREH